VWPSFDWDRAYADFIRAYRPLCTLGKLESRRGQEMAARCVVEAGTTALYLEIQHRVRAPVLRTCLVASEKTGSVTTNTFFAASAGTSRKIPGAEQPSSAP
jgi:hypothetical protein